MDEEPDEQDLTNIVHGEEPKLINKLWHHEMLRSGLLLSAMSLINLLASTHTNSLFYHATTFTLAAIRSIESSVTQTAI